MGKAVAVVEKQHGVMVIDLAKINYAAASDVAKKYIKSVGGGEGFKSQFPGTEIQFKSGQWMFNREAKLKAGTRLIVNVPNAMSLWVRWVEFVNKAGEDKRRPEYSGLTFPALGHDPVERASLGDLDESEWETDKDGKPMDPWKAVLVFPCRFENEDELHHIMLANKSSTIAGYNMYSAVMGELRSRVGELPVIGIGADKASIERTIEVKGRSGKKVKKKEKFVWDVPTFEVAGWVDAQDIDNPSAGGIQVTADDADADLGEVTTNARKATKAAKNDTVRASTKKLATRRSVEVEEDDEDEKPARVRAASKSVKPAPTPVGNKRRVVDDEDADL